MIIFNTLFLVIASSILIILLWVFIISMIKRLYKKGERLKNEHDERILYQRRRKNK